MIAIFGLRRGKDNFCATGIFLEKLFFNGVLVLEIW